MAKGKAIRQAERMSNLMEAQKLSEDEAQLLHEHDVRGLPLTDTDRYALERYRIEHFYAEGDLTPELIEFDGEGRTRQSVQRLECLVSKREWFEIRDGEDLDNNVLAFDRRRYLVQREVLGTVFSAAGIFDLSKCKFKPNATVDASTLGEFLRTLEIKRRQIETLFGMPLYDDYRKNPISQLKGILGLIGLDLELKATEQKAGKKVRRYGIPADTLDSLMNVVKRRDAKYQRDTAERIKPEDKVSRVTVNKLAAAIDKLKAKQASAFVRGSDDSDNASASLEKISSAEIASTVSHRQAFNNFTLPFQI